MPPMKIYDVFRVPNARGHNTMDYLGQVEAWDIQDARTTAETLYGPEVPRTHHLAVRPAPEPE